MAEVVSRATDTKDKEIKDLEARLAEIATKEAELQKEKEDIIKKIDNLNIKLEEPKNADTAPEGAVTQQGGGKKKKSKKVSKKVSKRKSKKASQKGGKKKRASSKKAKRTGSKKVKRTSSKKVKRSSKRKSRKAKL